jgi:hypothetical protein
MCDALPNPPRLPRPLPDPPREGWWLSPGVDPRVVRYHDGGDWTEFICRLGLRGPGAIAQSPISAQGSSEGVFPDDPELATLPTPGRFPIAFGSEGQAHPGWFMDPYRRGVRDIGNLRYYDGDRWTDFVCTLGLKGPGPITRSPRPDNKR